MSNFTYVIHTCLSYVIHTRLSSFFVYEQSIFHQVHDVKETEYFNVLQLEKHSVDKLKDIYAPTNVLFLRTMDINWFRKPQILFAILIGYAALVQKLILMYKLASLFLFTALETGHNSQFDLSLSCSIRIFFFPNSCTHHILFLTAIGSRTMLRTSRIERKII